MSSLYYRRASSSTRASSISSLSSRRSNAPGVRATDSISAILLGLTLRLLLSFVLSHSPKLTYILIGLWEGPVLHHFLEASKGLTTGNYDAYVGFGVRLFVDFIATDGDWRRTVMVCMWTGMGMVLADVAPAIWRDTGAKRGWHKVRRQLYILSSRLRAWSPTRLWRKPPPPRVTTIRFHDSLTRPGASPTEVTVTTQNGERDRDRDSSSILSGSSYTNQSDTVSSLFPQSILTTSVPPSAMAPSSVVSGSTARPPGPPSSIGSETETETIGREGSVTPPISGRRRRPVPPFPGFYPDHFSETGTDFSVVPPAAGTMHTTLGGTLDKGKSRADPYGYDDDDDMYTESGSDSGLTTSTTETPQANTLREIPDESHLPPPPAPALDKKGKAKALNLDLSVTSNEDEDDKLQPPASATIPQIPDDESPVTPAAPVPEPEPPVPAEEKIAEPAVTEPEPAPEPGRASPSDDDWEKVDHPTFGAPPAPASAPPVPPKDAAPDANDNEKEKEVHILPVPGPGSSAPLPPDATETQTPHQLKRKPSRSSLRAPSLISMAAPDIAVVPPSEGGDADSLWGGKDGVVVPPSSVVPDPSQMPIPEVDGEVVPDTQGGGGEGAGEVEAPPEVPPRENPYGGAGSDPEVDKRTPPPPFTELPTKDTPTINIDSSAAETPVADEAAAATEQPESETAQEPTAASSSTPPTTATHGQERLDPSSAPKSRPLSALSTKSTPSERLSGLIHLTNTQKELVKSLADLERDLKESKKAGVLGAGVSLTQKEEIRRIKEQLENIGEEIYLTQNPSIMESGGRYDYTQNSITEPLDLTGQTAEQCVDRVLGVLAEMVQDRIHSHRQSMLEVLDKAEEDKDDDDRPATPALDPPRALVVMFNGGKKGKEKQLQVAQKKAILEMCKEHSLNEREDRTNGRLLTITLPYNVQTDD